MKLINTDGFSNLLHDSFLKAFNSPYNLSDSTSLDKYIEIINNEIDKKRSKFIIPERSYLALIMQNHAPEIFISGQDFSEWSGNFHKLVLRNPLKKISHPMNVLFS